MEDLLLDLDFVIAEVEGSIDLVLDSNAEKSLLKRVLQTPLSSLGRYVIDSQGVKEIDREFGNGVYKELSEGLTINLIARIKRHIVEAVSYVKKDIQIRDIDVYQIDINTVQIDITLEAYSKVSIIIPI